MRDKEIISKECEILNYIRRDCKITKYSTENSDSVNIEIDYNYHYSMFYDIDTKELRRIYYGYKFEVDDLTKEFKKFTRKTKLEKLNKIL